MQLLRSSAAAFLTARAALRPQRSSVLPSIFDTSARQDRSPTSTRYPCSARSCGRRRRASPPPRRTGRGSRRCDQRLDARVVARPEAVAQLVAHAGVAEVVELEGVVGRGAVEADGRLRLHDRVGCAPPACRRRLTIAGMIRSIAEGSRPARHAPSATPGSRQLHARIQIEFPGRDFRCTYRALLSTVARKLILKNGNFAICIERQLDGFDEIRVAGPLRPTLCRTS